MSKEKFNIEEVESDDIISELNPKTAILRGIFVTIFIFAVKFNLEKLLSKNNISNFLSIAAVLSILFYLMSSYVPEFYKFIISGIGWGLGQSIMRSCIPL